MGNYPLGGEVHLSSLQAETIVYPAAKRYACDRCRTQKLRCPREQQGLHDPCARCIRAGVECVTSDAKPLGRPSRSDHRSIPPSRRQHPRPPQLPQPSMDSIQAIEALETLENDNGIAPSAIPPCIDPTTNQTMAEGWDNAFLQWNHQNGFSLGPHDHQDHYHHHHHHLPDTTMLDEDTAPINSDLALAFPPLATDTPSLTPPSASAWVDPAEPLQFPDREEDAVRRLASLAGSLQALLARMDPSLWDSILLNIACSNGSGPVTELPKWNPLDEALKGTAEFVAILQALHPSPSPPGSLSQPRRSPAGSAERPPTDSGPNRSIGGGSPMSGGSPSQTAVFSTPTVLMVIACHMQIIQLYDFIFTQGQISLQAMPEEEIASFRMLGGLQVAGIPLTQGHLQVKILIQVIEHQLHRMERLMGLPVEFRISGRSEVYQGLFNTLESVTLLRAALSRTEGMQSTTGVHQILSLKENMKSIQQML